MNAMISLKDAGLIVLFVALIIFVIYMIFVAKNLVVTVKSLNRVLEDTEVITDVAQKRTTDVDGIIDDGDIYGSTRQRSADTNRLIESPMTDRLEYIDIPEISLDIVFYERRSAQIGFREYLPIFTAINRPLDGTGELLCQV